MVYIQVVNGMVSDYFPLCVFDRIISQYLDFPSLLRTKDANGWISKAGSISVATSQRRLPGSIPYRCIRTSRLLCRNHVSVD